MPTSSVAARSSGPLEIWVRAASPSVSVPTPTTMSLGSPKRGTNLRIIPPWTKALMKPRKANPKAARSGSQLKRSRRKRLNVPSSAANPRTTSDPRRTSRPTLGKRDGVDESTAAHHAGLIPRLGFLCD